MNSPSALVTGGSSGIELATAQLLHDRGYRVAVTGSTEHPSSRSRAEPGVVVVTDPETVGH